MASKQSSLEDKAAAAPAENAGSPEHKAAPPKLSPEEQDGKDHEAKLRKQYDGTADLARAGGDTAETHREAVQKGETLVETYAPPHTQESHPLHSLKVTGEVVEK